MKQRWAEKGESEKGSKVFSYDWWIRVLRALQPNQSSLIVFVSKERGRWWPRTNQWWEW